MSQISLSKAIFLIVLHNVLYSIPPPPPRPPQSDTCISKTLSSLPPRVPPDIDLGL